MVETLSASFQKTRGGAIEVNGIEVFPSFRIQLEKGNHRFILSRLQVKSRFLQGVRIGIKKGVLIVNEQQIQDAVLWADTSPDKVELLVKAKSGCELIVWNIWKIDDLMQAWVGNAGIVIKKTDDAIILECSDGVGEIDFSNLIIELKKT
ncbi:hypothetical protein [Aquirhabdus parva]|uniref:Uncharacterized protein n=1 Tax=Aquirhabdus parva TaxID=2283318 RepID=A0A345P5P0_9GAMM|nr:hypothetical protein [Aquirhabdus parva]AXI02599.1 hypothetical protein HYN46_07020 [Aquirhabdus parva]